jgi:hypothetical protein
VRSDYPERWPAAGIRVLPADCPAVSPFVPDMLPRSARMSPCIAAGPPGQSARCAVDGTGTADRCTRTPDATDFCIVVCGLRRGRQGARPTTDAGPPLATAPAIEPRWPTSRRQLAGGEFDAAVPARSCPATDPGRSPPPLRSMPVGCGEQTVPHRLVNAGSGLSPTVPRPRPTRVSPDGSRSRTSADRPPDPVTSGHGVALGNEAGVPVRGESRPTLAAVPDRL